MVSHNTIDEEGSARAETSAATLNFGGTTAVANNSSEKTTQI